MNGLYISGLQRPKKPAIVQYDSLDDRKEVFYLLTKLPPWKRVAWLAWCCTQAALLDSKIRPVIGLGTKGQALEIFQDWWMLTTTHNVDADRCLRQLIQVVRNHQRGDGDARPVAAPPAEPAPVRRWREIILKEQQR